MREHDLSQRFNPAREAAQPGDAGFRPCSASAETKRTAGRVRPILFSGPMVRALIAGTKTQTRRLIPQATQDAYYEYDDWCRQVSAGVPTSRQWEAEYFLEQTLIKVGDRLWCRETWTAQMDHGWTIADARSRMFREKILYAADGKGSIDGWWPSIHMPREFSRLTLTVTDVRVQRLQDISADDAEAEGCPPCDRCGDCGWINEGPDGGWQRDAPGCGDAYVDQYARLWNRINGTGSWEANPWVAAYTFTVERRNIDEGRANLADATKESPHV
jgi:hypothetical protein